MKPAVGTNSDGATEAGNRPHRMIGHRGRIVALALVIIAVVLAASAFYSVAVAPSRTATAETTSTVFQINASAVVSAVSEQDPAGYSTSATGDLRPSSLELSSAGYAILGKPESTANLTVIVFNQVDQAETYFDSFRASVQGLPGYTDISSALRSFEGYGACYGYGEDVDGIAVAVGICTEGNVFIGVHITSSNNFATVEGDLTTLMGAASGSLS